MNRKMTFFTAPITALFLPKVYHDAAQSGGSRGVFYTLYLAALVTLVATVMFASLLVPQADSLANWLQTELPSMVWTPAGLTLGQDIPQPYTMSHPVFGPLVTFDMNKDVVQESEMGNIPVFVTSRKIFLRQGPGQIEERDITQTGFQAAQPDDQRRPLPSRVMITGDVVKQIYQNVKRIFFWVVPFVFLLVLFCFLLLAALFYSLVGLLLNLMRKNKLQYGSIFSLTCFALTASVALGWVVQNLPLAWFLNLLISLGYLFFAFKVTDQEPAKS
ncbi:MAG: hypothetical protein BWY44_01435 [Candidatus Omnitrophica bacterium ADurb.Bin292]|nr:MAG: hypothetical protein BWY44_01435 [Candidatus Omnitrophica bacterium ADurb.Bin292]